MSHISQASGTSTQPSARCDKRATVVPALVEFHGRPLGRLNCATVSPSEGWRKQEMALWTGQTKIQAKMPWRERFDNTRVTGRTHRSTGPRVRYRVRIGWSSYRRVARGCQSGTLGKALRFSQKGPPLWRYWAAWVSKRMPPFFSKLQPTSLRAYGDQPTSSAQSDRWFGCVGGGCIRQTAIMRGVRKTKDRVK